VRILAVYAHPDDESFGPAAFLAREARAGARVYGLFATRGERGATHLDPPPRPEELAELREQDLREVASLVGFEDLEILGYPDGSLDEQPAGELESRILAAIKRRKPDLLVTFGPAGITRHADHRAVHHAATAAFHTARRGRRGPRELLYDAVGPAEALELGLADDADGRPNVRLPVTPADRALQLAALQIHARHMADAREMVHRLRQRPRLEATFFRAWPAVTGRREVRPPEAPAPHATRRSRTDRAGQPRRRHRPEPGHPG
jgi:LmbE family N-acetylglucosaminyl deacetylase